MIIKNLLEDKEVSTWIIDVVITWSMVKVS